MLAPTMAVNVPKPHLGSVDGQTFVGLEAAR
jgi:hypothetical protein